VTALVCTNVRFVSSTGLSECVAFRKTYFFGVPFVVNATVGGSILTFHIIIYAFNRFRNTGWRIDITTRLAFFDDCPQTVFADRQHFAFALLITVQTTAALLIIARNTLVYCVYAERRFYLTVNTLQKRTFLASFVVVASVAIVAVTLSTRFVAGLTLFRFARVLFLPFPFCANFNDAFFAEDFTLVTSFFALTI